ncbi:MAG: fimbrillin family protein, partial [Bacteroidales bacterium]
KYTEAGYIKAGEPNWATSFANNNGTTISALGSLTADNNGVVASAGMFHAMVLPETKESVDNHTATIFIDGVSHNISLKVGQRLPNTPQGFLSDWEAGKNYTYNLKLSGNNQLTVSTVTVTQWTEGGSSDIEI